MGLGVKNAYVYVQGKNAYCIGPQRPEKTFTMPDEISEDILLHREVVQEDQGQDWLFKCLFQQQSQSIQRNREIWIIQRNKIHILKLN